MENAVVRKVYPVAAHGGGATSPARRSATWARWAATSASGRAAGISAAASACWPRTPSGQALVPDRREQVPRHLGQRGPAYFVSASSLGPALVALGAKVKLVRRRARARSPVEKFFVAPKTDGEREIALAAERDPDRDRRAGGRGRNATYEVRQKEALDWPLATASVALRMKGSTVARARVVLGHVAPTPWVAAEAGQALAGKTITAEVAEEAGKAARGRRHPAQPERLQSATGARGGEARAAGRGRAGGPDHGTTRTDTIVSRGPLREPALERPVHRSRMGPHRPALERPRLLVPEHAQLPRSRRQSRRRLRVQPGTQLLRAL